MKIEIKEINGIKIAEIISDKVIINETQDALDIMAEASYLGSGKIIIQEKNLNPDFFELKTRLAGDILQKFSNYRCRLAIIDDFEKYTSKSLHDFIYESNKSGRIYFVGSIDEARKSITRNID